MTYGIIKNKDGSTYVSPIFALKYAGWKSEVIVFDETFEKIKKIKMWHSGFGGIHRIVFVLENDFDTSGGDFAGYDWVINDKALFKALRSKKGVNIGYFPLFKNYCKEIQLPEFFEIKDDKSYDAYNINLKWKYTNDYGYDTKAQVIVIKKDDKMYVVEKN